MTKIMFDYGHGGDDSGAIGHGLKEKDVVRKLGQMTKAELEDRYEVEVLETRSGDQTRSLNYRTDLANQKDVDYFISFHNNAFNTKAKGFESFIHDKLSDGSSTNKKRNIIHDEIMSVLKKYGIDDRGKKKANFHVLRETVAEAVLIEYLFIDFANEAELLKKDSFLREVAVATAIGLGKALNLKAKPKPKPTPTKASNGKLYRVQVGAFASKANAENLAKELNGKGYATTIKYD